MVLSLAFDPVPVLYESAERNGSECACFTRRHRILFKLLGEIRIANSRRTSRLLRRDFGRKPNQVHGISCCHGQEVVDDQARHGRRKSGGHA